MYFYLSLYFWPPWKFKILELALAWSQIQELFLNSASSNTSKHSPKPVMYRIYKMHPLFLSLASGFKESFEICSRLPPEVQDSWRQNLVEISEHKKSWGPFDSTFRKLCGYSLLDCCRTWVTSWALPSSLQHFHPPQSGDPHIWPNF